MPQHRRWNHPCTSGQIEKLVSWGVRVIQPVSKVLMCGDSGVGAMAEVACIRDAMLSLPPPHDTMRA